jgi:esterase/lipase superfamily enzyme
MELLLFGRGGEPVLVFPTSLGRFFQAEDFGLVASIADRIDRGRYTLCCVDGVDRESWYNRASHPADRVRRHEQYEAYVLEEVVPLLRYYAPNGRLTLTGASFGGFHTMLIGLRHPQTFARLLSLAGKFETETFLHGYHDERVYFHSPLQWVPNLLAREHLEPLYKTEITLAVGEHDFCRSSTERLSGILWQKGIGNHLSVWDGGGHDWPVWRQMFRAYLPD